MTDREPSSDCQVLRGEEVIVGYKVTIDVEYSRRVNEVFQAKEDAIRVAAAFLSLRGHVVVEMREQTEFRFA